MKKLQKYVLGICPICSKQVTDVRTGLVESDVLVNNCGDFNHPFISCEKDKIKQIKLKLDDIVNTHIMNIDVLR